MLKYSGIVLSLLILINGITSCNMNEKPEILLVGVFHGFPDDQQCNWERTYHTLVKFRPDQIAIEYDQPGDSVSLKNYLGYDYQYTWDSLKTSWVGAGCSLEDSIQLYQRKVLNGSGMDARVELWKYYHLSADIGNRDFQSYLMMADSDSQALRPDTTEGVLNDIYARHHSIIKRRKNGEFFNLIFPLAKELEINYLYPTDYKGTYALQSSIYQSLAQSLETSEDWTKYMMFWNSFNRTLESQAAACTAIEYTNTEEWISSSDFGQTRILDYLNNKHFNDYKNVWYKRNLEIAGRIDQAVIQSGAKRMVVFYGNMHIFPLRKFLVDKGYQVKLLEDISWE